MANVVERIKTDNADNACGSQVGHLIGYGSIYFCHRMGAFVPKQWKV